MGKDSKHTKDRKKSKKSRRRSDSDSSFTDERRSHKKKSHKDHEADLVERKIADLEKERLRRKEEKEIMKAYETPEEKRARRLAKKEVKERKRKMDMGWDQETLQYTNEDNPFGDHNLTETFVWGAKLKGEGKQVSKGEVQKMQRERMEENRRELEKVKKRRVEREREREQMELERQREQKDKETDYYSAWEKQEDTFHLDQAKERSRIRIEDGRAKPIDLLAKYINAKDTEMSVELHEPYTYLEGLTSDDLEDLLEDITVYLELEKGKNQGYWKDITIVTEDQLSQVRKMDPRQFDRYRRDGIHNSVTQEVNAVFKGKSLNQLSILMEQIEKKLKGGEGVDVTYWESLRQQLTAHMALTRLKEQHQVILKQRLAQLKQEQMFDSPAGSPAVKLEQGARDSPVPQPKSEFKVPPLLNDDSEAGPSSKPDAEEEPGEPDADWSANADTADDDMEEVYDSGRYSPRLLDSVDETTLIYSPLNDMKRLEMQRLTLTKTGSVKTDTDSEMIKRAREGMDDEEARFSVEFNLEAQSFIWSDKYRPRKPRFFNRVHTGFEWNKYNQTHYDMDNPPPKIVQGYKFNIFYPDLIDKSKTPEYSVVPIDDDKDFAILKFTAGPPYEDIAFKIVNREWEYSYKHGFKCQFHNDIFQLWFHFRRYRYRR